MLYHQRYDLNKGKEGNIEEKFLSHVSHRVRTPLNSVIGFSKLLMSTDLSEHRTREFAEKIMDSGYQILQYFQNLIDLSELESGMIKVNPAKVGIRQLLTGVVGGYKDRLGQDHSIDIYLTNSENELVVSTDEYILERIINNLIELSRSHIEQGLVTIDYEQLSDDQVSMEIRGIKSSELNGHNRERSAEAVECDYFTWKAVRELVELLQGEVSSRSDNHEVIYTIQFPYKP